MHPLEPLTEQEITAAVDITRREGMLEPTVRLPLITLEEPDKAAVRDIDAGRRADVDRQVRVVCFDLDTKAVREVIVSLTQARVIADRWREGVGPGLLDEERAAFEQAIRRDARWRDAMRRRGIDDLDAVHFECVAAAPPDTADQAGAATRQRRARCVGFLKHGPADNLAEPGSTKHAAEPSGPTNYYAHPIDGVVVLVDVATCTVLDVQETQSPLPVPDEPGGFDPASIAARGLTVRDDLEPLDIVQREGPSFQLDGWSLAWQRWQMRIGFHPVEGLVLHRVGYRDGGQLRPVLYRAALSEMVVPYADASISQYWRAVFDAGEVGLGRHANSLEHGCDCLGEIRYLDAVVADVDGTPRTIRNAICIHEEDFGILWKHDGVHVATSEARRNRRLVVSFFATVGNYDYGFYWYFSTDGSIEAEIRLTGIIYTGATDSEEPRNGVRVAPNLYGPHHQHLFCFRLDMEVDGPANSVYEVDAELVPLGRDNPHGNAFRAVSRPLRTEAEAQRTVDVGRARYWKVVNEHHTNRLGEPVAYKLVPQPGASLIAHESAHVSTVGAFARRHLWVTPFDADQRYAAGDYPAFGDAGLGEWTRADRNVNDTDIVLWHTVGTTHIVRPEDWPVMPVERVGFALRPLGFFAHNPALDLPPPGHGAPRCHS